jgi:DNA repair protein RadC
MKANNNNMVVKDMYGTVLNVPMVKPVYNIGSVKLADLIKVVSSLDAYKVAIEFFNPDTIGFQEQMIAIYLNRANKIIGVYPMTTGGVSGTVADPKMIYGIGIAITEEAKILGRGLMSFASGVILAHNHPSGNLQPSQSDIDLTKKVKAGAKFLEMEMLDHLIVTPDKGKYYSFADEGMI